VSERVGERERTREREKEREIERERKRKRQDRERKRAKERKRERGGVGVRVAGFPNEVAGGCRNQRVRGMPQLMLFVSLWPRLSIAKTPDDAGCVCGLVGPTQPAPLLGCLRCIADRLEVAHLRGDRDKRGPGPIHCRISVQDK
jgi:hypothetical protein